MENSKDDPQSFMFACDNCGAWPMAYEAQHVTSEGLSFRFACPGCKRHSVKATRPRRALAVRAA